MNQEIGSGNGRKGNVNWQCVAVEKSIKRSSQLNVGGKNNQGSNMGGFRFGQLN